MKTTKKQPAEKPKASEMKSDKAKGSNAADAVSAKDAKKVKVTKK
jgi:hypothetical protein